MKYNQDEHKLYLEKILLDILALLDINESRLPDITFREIRQKMNILYPVTQVPEDNISYPANDVILRDRKKIFNTARYTIYTLNAIRKREQDVI